MSLKHQLEQALKERDQLARNQFEVSEEHVSAFFGGGTAADADGETGAADAAGGAGALDGSGEWQLGPLGVLDQSAGSLSASAVSGLHQLSDSATNGV